MIFHAVLVFCGCGCGGILRWLIGKSVAALAGTAVQFPAGTLIANTLACICAGLVTLAGTHLSPDLRLFLLTGFLGGLGTMSAFPLETLELLKSGAWQIALANFVLTFVFCFGTMAVLLYFEKGSLH